MGFGGTAGGTQSTDLLANPSSGEMNMGAISGGMLALGLASAGAQAGASIYGSKKAASIQREGMAQAREQLESGRRERSSAYKRWFDSQAPIRAARLEGTNRKRELMGLDPLVMPEQGRMAALGVREAEPASPAMDRVRQAPQVPVYESSQAPMYAEQMGGLVPEGPYVPPVDSRGRVPIETAEIITEPVPRAQAPHGAPPNPMDYMPESTMGDLYA
jgi:hypothetical protein